MTCRAVHAEQKPPAAISGRRIDPERGVLLISNKPQFPIYQGVRVECPHGQPPHAGNPLAVGDHGATVPPRHSAWQRPLPAAGCYGMQRTVSQQASDGLTLIR
jgi:hypothetical protein